jgi:hypothetical protein
VVDPRQSGALKNLWSSARRRAVESSDAATLRAYALRNGARLRVVLDNLQDPAANGARKVTVNLPRNLPGNLGAAYRKGDLVRLSGPALDARTEIALGGSTVRDDGTFASPTRTPVEISGRSITLSLPAGSATLLTLTP